MSTSASYLSGEIRNVAKDKILRKLSLRQWILAIIILYMSVWSPAEIFAQQSDPVALDMTVFLGSLETKQRIRQQKIR